MQHHAYTIPYISQYDFDILIRDVEEHLRHLKRLAGYRDVEDQNPMSFGWDGMRLAGYNGRGSAPMYRDFYEAPYTDNYRRANDIGNAYDDRGPRIGPQPYRPQSLQRLGLQRPHRPQNPIDHRPTRHSRPNPPNPPLPSFPIVSPPSSPSPSSVPERPSPHSVPAVPYARRRRGPNGHFQAPTNSKHMTPNVTGAAPQGNANANRGWDGRANRKRVRVDGARMEGVEGVEGEGERVGEMDEEEEGQWGDEDMEDDMEDGDIMNEDEEGHGGDGDGAFGAGGAGGQGHGVMV